MSEKTSEKIISLIRNDSTITIERLAKSIGVTERTVERNMKILQDKKLIRRIGSAKAGTWKIEKVSLDKKTGDGLIEAFADRLVEGLVESQKLIIRLVEKNPTISKNDMAKTIGISTTALDKNIETLKKKGLLQRVGSAKGGHWKIVDK